MRYHLTKLLDFYDKWKITINEDKTETITFTRKITNIKTITKLKINDKIIGKRNSVKYLQILTLDKRLSLSPYITQTLNRTYATIHKLYPLINRRSQLSTDSKLALYKTIFRPFMGYACVSWNFISDTQCKKLQTTQYTLLRLFTNSNRYTPIVKHHRPAKILMMKDFIVESSQKFLIKNSQRSVITADLIDVYIHDNPTHTHKLLHQRLPIYLQRR